MPETLDIEELKAGLIIFRRGDVQHQRWYCRLKVPNEDRYKTVSLKTTDKEDAKNRAFDHDAELRFKVKHEMPVFSRTFAQVAKEFSDFQKQRSEIGHITHHRWRVLDSHTTEEGKPAKTLYYWMIESVLKESGLQKTSSGSQRSTYCFRHTYATFRLTEGVDVYFLSKQMGTSVKMIEDHYGHVNPVKNADLILKGLPGWESTPSTEAKELAEGKDNDKPKKNSKKKK